jgi:hypothetical protein
MVLLSNVGLVELYSVCLEIVLILTQYSRTVCTGRTIGSQIVFDASDGLISDMGHVESRFSPFGDSVSVSARQVHGLHQTYHTHRNRFGPTRWDSLVTEAQVKDRFGPFGDSATLDHDRCTVCAKRTVGLEIVLEAPDGTPS